jgi:hypothetical protein
MRSTLRLEGPARRLSRPGGGGPVFRCPGRLVIGVGCAGEGALGAVGEIDGDGVLGDVNGDHGVGVGAAESEFCPVTMMTPVSHTRAGW